MASPAPAASVAVHAANGGLTDPLLVSANGHGNTPRKAAHGAKGKYWVAADKAERRAAKEAGCEEGRALLFRKYKVKGALLHPYRLLIIIRLIAVLVFFAWRIRHNKSDIMWFWTMSIVGDVWFGFSWLLNQLPKFNPIKTIPDLAALKRHFGFPDGTSRLPGIDVFVTTADPIDEPILYTMNCVLSILAVDYPVDRLACYLSDDSGALILYEALVEVEKIAPLWVPFCRKYSIEPRAPESYFEHVAPPQAGRVTQEFLNDYRRVQMEYDDYRW